MAREAFGKLTSSQSIAPRRLTAAVLDCDVGVLSGEVGLKMASVVPERDIFGRRYDRRSSLTFAGSAMVAAALGPSRAMSLARTRSGVNKVSEPRQGSVTTAVLKIAYEDSGPASGKPVVLLHGFPYDVRQYDAVRHELASRGLRVLVPYLRGFGPTRYRDQQVFRSGQQAALGKDVIDFLDELHISQALLVGYDWGGRAACVAAALWPERVRGLISCSGYTIQNIAESASQPVAPAEAYVRWYTFYFNTKQGVIGLDKNRSAFCELLWKLWSPTWRFTEEEYQRTALSFKNPDFVATVIHQYRHRYGNVPGDPAYEEIEARLAQQPAVDVPTIVLSGKVDGVEPPPSLDPHRGRFKGAYDRHILPEVGHCVPAEAPLVMAQAVEHLLNRID